MYEVKYLEATGTQWIDTGIDISSLNYTIKAKAEDEFAFGYCHQNLTSGTWLGVTWYSKNEDNIRLFYKNYNTVKETPKTSNRTYTIDFENGKFYCDDDLIYLFSPGVGSDSIKNISLPIFEMYNFEKNSVQNNGRTSKCYSFQIYESDVLVRDFIPVIDNSGKACMYDKASG